MLQTIDITDVLSLDNVNRSGSSYLQFSDEKIAFINNIQSPNSKESDIRVVIIDFISTEIMLMNFGGSLDDIQHDVVSNGKGSIIIVGETYSSDFSILSPQDTDLQGSVDSFVMQVDASLNMDWVTIFGGNGSILTQTWCS